MKKSALLILSSLVSFQLFAMEALTDADLQQVEGQAGADLSLKLVLNQVNTKDSFYTTSDKSYATNNAYKFDNEVGGVCEKVAFCHLALSVNNRYVDSNGMANSSEGKKLWVVFKGIQGTINVQKLGLDGADVIFKNVSGVATGIKPAIQLSFDATNPIQIRNYGFDALSIEQDKFTSKTNTDGSVVENVTKVTNADGSTTTTNPKTDFGYLQDTKYDTTTAANPLYDQGKETGFMGMRMNGNLALQGKLMMFSCDKSNNSRC